jgi:hypothetical protein
VVEEKNGLLEPETGAGEPLNAETPPEGLVHFITPAQLRFVRNHFPVPHAGRQPALRIGGRWRSRWHCRLAICANCRP